MNTDTSDKCVIIEIHQASIYLISCALNGTAPDETYMSCVDQESLYDWALSQNIHALLGWLLGRSGTGDMSAKWDMA